MKTVISRICNMIWTVSTKYRRLCAGLTRQIDLLRQVQNPFCVFYFRLFFIKQHRGPRNSLNAWYSADVQSVSTSSSSVYSLSKYMTICLISVFTNTLARRI